MQYNKPINQQQGNKTSKHVHISTELARDRLLTLQMLSTNSRINILHKGTCVFVYKIKTIYYLSPSRKFVVIRV